MFDPSAPPGFTRRRPAARDYGISSGDDGLLAWAWVAEQCQAARNYWVVSTRANGSPHAAPVWGAWVGNSVAFGTGASSLKARNLKRDPRCVVHLEGGDNTVILEGRAVPLADPALRAAFDAEYQRKYSMSMADAGDGPAWLLLALERVLAWREADFPNTATRWDVGRGGCHD